MFAKNVIPWIRICKELKGSRVEAAERKNNHSVSALGSSMGTETGASMRSVR